MGLMDFIKGELIEIIEWTDDSRDTLSYRFPDDDKAIKNGAQLIVRESQQVQFVYLGEFGDTFGPGKHTLTTDNIPILTRLKSWKYGFNSPFKADVYYVTTRLFTGNKWGTANPIMMRDDDLGIVRARAFGTFDFRIMRPEAVSEGSRRLRSQFPARRVRRHDALAHRQRVRRCARVGEGAGVRRREPLHRAWRSAAAADQSGGRREVRHPDRELHRRERVGAAGSGTGDRQALEHGGGREPERLREVPDGAGDGEGRQLGRHGDRAGRRPVDRAADHAAAGDAGCGERRRPRRSRLPSRCRNCCRPRTSRRRSACPKRDVMAIIESGELAAKKIGSSYRIKRQRGRRVPARNKFWPRCRILRAAREIPVRRMRGAGGMESVEAAAGLSVLRNRGAVHRRRRRRAPWSRTIWSRRCASCRTKRAAGWRRSARSSARAARRSRCSIRNASGRTATSAALRHWSTTRRSRRRSGRRASCPSRFSEAQVREQIRQWYASKWLAPGEAEDSRARRSRARRATSRTGRSTRMSSVRGRPKRGTTTTRPSRIATTRAARRRGRSGTCAGNRPRASSGISSTTSRCPARTACRTTLLREIEPFRTAELVPYDTAYLSGFIVEHYQIVLLEAAQASQDAMTRKLEEMCAAAGSRGYASQSADSSGIFAGRRSSTYWYRSGCCRTLYGTKRSPGRGERLLRADGRPVSEEPLEDRFPRAVGYHRVHHLCDAEPE